MRDKIGKFARQVKPFENSGLPLVLVLANPNNTLVPLGEFEIRAAMYGMPMFGGELEPDSNAKALAILDGLKTVEAPDGDLIFARVFHTESDHAVPLPRELFDGPRDFHMYLSRTP